MRINEVYIGDVLDFSAGLEPQSIQTIVTSPPYFGLRSYLPADHPDKGKEIGGEPTPAEFVAALVAVFRALRPALRDDGTLWLNLGDSYANDTKWGGATSGKHADGLIGTTGIGRGRHTTGLPSKCLMGIPWRVAFALIDDGWVLRSDIVWAKPNAMPESVSDRPTRSHEYLFLFAKGPRYHYDAQAIKEPFAKGSAARVSQASLDTQRGGSKTEAYQANHPGKKARDRRPADILRAMRDNGSTGRNKRDVWTIPTAPYPGAHFATFPPALIRPCILAGTSAAGQCADCGRPWRRVTERTAGDLECFNGSTFTAGKTGAVHETRGQGPRYQTRDTGRWRPDCECGTHAVPQIVCDPFCGSGTTPLVAVEEGRRWIASDLDARSREWTAARLATVQTRLAVGQ